MTYLNSENLPMLIGAIVVTMVVFITGILFARHLYKTADSRKIKSIINQYSVAHVREVICTNGMGGYFFIDYLVLLPGRILALNLQEKEGYIFGGKGIEMWTLVNNNKSSKFRNPLEDVILFAKYVEDLLKFNEVAARVLFDGKGKFPKGVPEGVLQMASFKENMVAWAGDKPTEAVRNTWDSLATLLAESRERYVKETS